MSTLKKMMEDEAGESKDAFKVLLIGGGNGEETRLRR
jgi:hypothetical protein